MTAKNAAINLTYNLTNVELANSYTDVYAGIENAADAADADVVNVVFNLDNVDGLDIDIDTNDNGVSSKADVITFNVAAGGLADTGGSSELGIDDFETVNMNINGDAIFGGIDNYNIVGAAQTINIVANANLTTGTWDEADDQAVTVNISGTGNVTIAFNGDNEGFTLNAAQHTGKLDVEVGTNGTYALKVTAGTNDDTITLITDFELNAEGDAFLQVLDGGDGTNTFEIDAQRLSNGIELLNEDVADFSAAVKNFERLSLTGVTDQAIDATTLGFQDVTIDGYANGGGSLTVATGASVTVTGTGTGDAPYEVIVADADTGEDDSLTITVKGVDGIELTALTVADVETINLVSTASDASDEEAGSNTVKLLADGTVTLNISGTTALDLADSSFAMVETVSAASFHAGLTIDVSSSTEITTITIGNGDNNIVASGQKDTITTGSGYDTIDSGAGNDVISTGNGGSFINAGEGKDTITLGTAATDADIDTIYFGDVTDSQGVTVDVINGFQVDVASTTAGSVKIINDVLDFQEMIGIVEGSYLGEANGYGAVLTSLTAEDVTQAVLDTSTNTLYIDINGDGALTADDMAIQLTGVTSLSAANFIWGEPA
jgi:hypothetical protein